MNEFALLYPPDIRFGWGCRESLAEMLSGLDVEPSKKTLFVCSESACASGLVEPLLHVCGSTASGVFTGVPHDPALEIVDAIVDQCRELDAKVVVAIGGGSVIDAAKAAAVLAPLEGTTADYFHGRRAITGAGLPLIALPTTAGTGAEITKNSVLSDHATGVKKSLRSPHMVPCAALVDPQLTVSMPSALTAASGLDALTQAVESFLSLKANSVSRALARQAVPLLMEFLPRAFLDGSDQAARTAVAEGSLLSAMAFSQSGLGAVHGLAHPIGLDLDLPHGLVCAVLLPHVLHWNASVCGPALDTLALEVALPDGAAFVARVETLCGELGISANFAGTALKGSIDHIVANCRSGSMAANPRPMSDEDVRNMLERLA